VIDELAHATATTDLRFHPLFRRRSHRLTPRLQQFRARFLSWASAHSQPHAHSHAIGPDPLAAEEIVLALLRAALTDDDPRCSRPSRSTQHLIRRTKAFLEAEFATPIQLADIGRAVEASPLYLTQIFRNLEDVPLH